MIKRIIQDFRDNIETVCQFARQQKGRAQSWYANYRLAACLKKQLSKSPEGKAQVAYLKKHKIKLEAKKSLPGVGRYEVTIQDYKDGKPVWGEGKIQFNAARVDLKDTAELTAIFYHEIWHIRQFYNGVGSMPKDAPVEDYCWWERSIEADAQSFATEMCYRLKLRGDDKPWKYYLEHEAVSPMCKAFEVACQKDVKSLDNGVARRRAFDAWFTSEFLKDHYDACGVSNYQKNQERLQAGPDFNLPKRHLTFKDVEKLGDIANVSYLKLPGFKNLAAKKYRGNMGPETKEEIQQIKRSMQINRLKSKM